MILIIAAYAVLAITFTIGKMLLSFVPPIFLIGFRMTIAGMILLVLNFAWHKNISIKRSDLPMFGLLSMIHITIPYVFEFIALQSIAPSCAAFMFNLSPFFSAFFSYIYFCEQMTVKKWTGLAIAMGAMILFAEPGSGKYIVFGTIMPYILMTICVASCALAWIYIRGLVKNGGYSPMLINGWAMLLGGLQSLTLARYFEPEATLPWGNMTQFLLLLCAIILIANILFYNLYGYLLKKYTATLLAFVGFVTPAFVPLYDWIFLGLTISFSMIIAMVLVGFGIYIFYHEELRQGYVVKDS